MFLEPAAPEEVSEESAEPGGESPATAEPGVEAPVDLEGMIAEIDRRAG